VRRWWCNEITRIGTENVRRRSSPEYQELLASISNNIMALENTVIQDKLTAAFGEMCYFKRKDIFSFEIPADKITAIVLFFKK
jgi:hypothetical protein